MYNKLDSITTTRNYFFLFKMELFFWFNMIIVIIGFASSKIIITLHTKDFQMSNVTQCCSTNNNRFLESAAVSEN